MNGFHPTRAEDQCQITIQRDNSWVGWMCAYRVMIDGEDMAFVRAGRAVSFSVAPGTHSIGIRQDECFNREITFFALPGEKPVFHCGCDLGIRDLFLAVFHGLIDRDGYVWIRRVD